MNFKLWEASKRTKKNSELFAFENFISKKINRNFQNNYKKIHKWSIDNSQDFWSFFFCLGVGLSPTFLRSCAYSLVKLA